MQFRIALSCLLFLLKSAGSTQSHCKALKTIKSKGKSMFYIIGFFPVMNEHPNNISTNGILKSEVMMYEISKFNGKYRKINGSTIIGYKLFDTCGPDEVDVTSEAFLTLALGEPYLRSDYSCPCEKRWDGQLQRTLGIVGPSISSKSAHLNRLLFYKRIPMVSYGSTSPELSNKEKYPHFYRTILSDVHQARFLTEFLIAANWRYISVLNSDDPYGRAGAHELSISLCVYLRKTLKYPLDDLEIENVMKRLNSTRNSNVVVLWGHFNLVQAVLMRAAEYGVVHKIWIISEVSGQQPWFLSNENKLVGTVYVVVPNGGNYTDFEEHFFNLTYETSNNSLWLQAFFRSKDIDSRRNGSLRLGHFRHLFQLEEVGFLRNAVATYLNAFSNFVHAESGCDIGDETCIIPLIRDHRIFSAEYLQKIRFKGLDNHTISFDENGDLKTGSFDLFEADKEKQEFVLTAHWDSNTDCLLNKIAMDAIRSKGKSSCSEICPPGSHPLYNNLKKCCWKCVKCKHNHINRKPGSEKCTPCNTSYVSNSENTECIPLAQDFVNLSEEGSILIIILATFGMLLTSFVIATFIHARKTTLILSTNIVPSIAQLFIHLILFLSPLLLLGVDTPLKCAVRVHGVGFLFVLVISIRLVKVLQISWLFNMTHRISRTEKQQLTTTIFTIIATTLLIEAILIVVSDDLKPITVVDEYDQHEHTVRHSCNANTALLYQIVYILFLQLGCGVQAFLARKLPDSFNESISIAFAMFSSCLVMAFSIPLFWSFTLQKMKNVVLFTGILVTNIVWVVVLYFYKVYLIYMGRQRGSSIRFDNSSPMKAPIRVGGSVSAGVRLEMRRGSHFHFSSM